MKLYQKLFQEMLAKHEPLFARFKEVHDQYVKNPDTVKAEFNKTGAEVLRSSANMKTNSSAVLNAVSTVNFLLSSRKNSGPACVNYSRGLTLSV